MAQCRFDWEFHSLFSVLVAYLGSRKGGGGGAMGTMSHVSLLKGHYLMPFSYIRRGSVRYIVDNSL